MENNEKITGNLTIESSGERYDINVSKVGLVKTGAYTTLGGVLMGTSIYAAYKAVRWIVEKLKGRFANHKMGDLDVVKEIPEKKRGRKKVVEDQ